MSIWTFQRIALKMTLEEAAEAQGKSNLKTLETEDTLIATRGVIDRDDPRPLHKQVYEALLAAISDGRLPLRGKLPSERELVDLYDVSRITIRHAVRELIQQGVVHSQP